MISGENFGQAIDRPMVERTNAQNLETSLENLKALVEGGG